MTRAASLAHAVALALALAACGGTVAVDVDLSSPGTLRGSLSQLPGLTGGFSRWASAGATVSRTLDTSGHDLTRVRSARLVSGSVTLVAPEGRTLAFVTSFSIRAVAPGLEKVTIAHQDAAFAEGGGPYPLVLADVDLKPYLETGSLTLEPWVETSTRPSQDHEIDVALQLRLDVSLAP